MTKNDITYWDYLGLSQILTAQNGLENSESKINNHELHFIIIHQVYELWFKLAIKEIRDARDKLIEKNVPEEIIPEIVQHINRVIEIMKLAINQFTLLETMAPQDFLCFRSKLGTASGFQSIQMRELEILLGLENDDRIKLGQNPVLQVLKASMEKSDNKEEILSRLRKIEAEPTIKEGVIKWLSRTPIDGIISSDEKYDKNVEHFINAYYNNHCKLQDEMAEGLIASKVDTKENISERFEKNKSEVSDFIQANDKDNSVKKLTRNFRAGLIFIESYRELPLLSWPRKLIDSIVEMEELLIVWRSRHARMVERMIGRRVGTGGSSGVEYLDATTKYRIFKDLWTVRSLLLPKENLPKLKNEKFYNFNI